MCPLLRIREGDTRSAGVFVYIYTHVLPQGNKKGLTKWRGGRSRFTRSYGRTGD